MSSFVQTLKNQYHLVQALLANIWYGFPSRRLKVIGITGTDGKTTTTHLIYDILRKSGRKVSMISTVYAKVGGHEYETGLHTTTPDPFLVQSMLHAAVQNGDEYFVLETTSHALDQNRVWGVRYEMGVITNITHEHLDYHRDYGRYLTTKRRLMERSRLVLLNKDDSSYAELVKSLSDKMLITYSLSGEADFTTDFRNSIADLADFNAYNFLAAYAACVNLGVSEEQAKQVILQFQLPPGRVDMVYKGTFAVMVDFAHTPNAIDNILKTVKRIYLKKEGRIIHVFGSAGLRDITKRPLMGEASGKTADIVILTEEDYRTEDPQEICESIASGIRKKGLLFAKTLKREDRGKYTIVLDRKTAIQEAIRIAGPGDLVIVTGKGHEKSLCRGSTEYPWSDREAILEVLKI